MKQTALFLLLTTLLVLPTGLSGMGGQPEELVSIEDVDPSILVEARYFGSHNFVGRPIRGYEAPKCLLTRAAANALAEVQKDFLKAGYTLKVYDCFRPQRAVDHFVEWARDPKDQKMKAEFYPKEKKEELFQNGYIASRSGHSRGSTLDLTLVKLPAKANAIYSAGQKLVDCTSAQRFEDNSIDMGTGYDCFHPLSHTDNPGISVLARKNRDRLRSRMQAHGFQNYSKEWWHFTLKNEPFPNTYMDRLVK
ncbi:MAG: M15 family metallopeptidase [Bdellovibrionales bacterium]|nr:M15 family metallopeptidase [Bdellovibrionales bacterium]